MELALAGVNAVMPIIVRKSNDPYEWEIGHAPLAEVANVEQKMPADYISEDGFFITEACREYLAPLIAGEDFPPFENGPASLCAAAQTSNSKIAAANRGF